MFRNRLREARQHAGLTQGQLASLVGVAKSTMAGYENGVSEPDMDKMEKIMAALKVDANFLLQDEMEKGGGFSFSLSYPEMQRVERYRTLDDAGKSLVEHVIAYAVSRPAQADETVAWAKQHVQAAQEPATGTGNG